MKVGKLPPCGCFRLRPHSEMLEAKIEWKAFHRLSSILQNEKKKSPKIILTFFNYERQFCCLKA